MGLKEIDDRYDELVAAVRLRISRDGGNPDKILDGRRANLKLRAVTLEQDAPLYYSPNYLRRWLQSSATIDSLADRFIQEWRRQQEIDDESIGEE